MKQSLTAAEYDLEGSYWWFVGRRAILDSVLKQLGNIGSLAVDVGCGSGRNMMLLAPYAGRVIGVDRSPKALEIARSRGLSVHSAGAEELPLPSSSVDAVTSFDVLEHLDDDVQALAEFNRVLKPNGMLFITVPAYRFLWSEHDEALMHRRRYVASELHMKLNRMGFAVRFRSYAIFFTFLPIVLYRLFRGLIPNDPMAPKASHVILPRVLNDFFIWTLRIEARLLRYVRLPWGSSIVVVAQKQPAVAPAVPTRQEPSREECLVA
jgi:ubiquinone/menaquinone biosynthesis C-methylase UbiE